MIDTDYIAGYWELFTHLHRLDKFKENEMRIYIAETVLALEKLHGLRIVYRDLKLENILLDPNGHIVLVDFGLSAMLNERSKRESFCGTLEYMAPEMVKQECHNECLDWWAVGVLAFELLTGHSPFRGGNEAKFTAEEIQRRIFRQVSQNSPPLPDGISAHAKDFITRLLIKDPAQRFGE